MNSDLITQPLPSRSTLNQTSIWFHTHIEPNSKCIMLNSATTRMYIGNAYRFLTKSLPNASYINNDPSLYVVSSLACFFIFTTEVANGHNSHRCDNQYGYWENNGTTVKVYKGMQIKRTYFYDKRNPKLRKQEFHLLTTVPGSKYRGIMIYYKPINVNIVADPTLVSP